MKIWNEAIVSIAWTKIVVPDKPQKVRVKREHICSVFLLSHDWL